MMAFAHIQLVPVKQGLAPHQLHHRANEVYAAAGLADAVQDGCRADLSGEVATVMRRANRVRRALNHCGAKHELAALVRLEMVQEEQRLRRLS